jgi:phage terminase small subunit
MTRTARRNLPEPPGHLRAATRDWWRGIVEAFEIDPHVLRLLTAAGEAWDRAEAAREALALHGLTYTVGDTHPRPFARPEVKIEHDSMIRFARLLRELALDVEPPAEVRPPRRPGTGV